jgi:hypothetical protein
MPLAKKMNATVFKVFMFELILRNGMNECTVKNRFGLKKVTK